MTQRPPHRRPRILRRPATAIALLLATPLLHTPASGQPADDREPMLHLELRDRVRPADGRAPATPRLRTVTWDAGATALIICDCWDSHHSVTAVRRLSEFAPRLDAVAADLRRRGATIIHAPSDCMDAYHDHPARTNALAAPAATDPPPGMDRWCHRIPQEESAAYPIDQSDGGEDEDPAENTAWNAVLAAQGRNPATPWLRQSPLLAIEEADYVAAEGGIVWNILEAREIRHVILAGVHTNMCVLGRPFGLRRMVQAGMDTVLLRDCTDVMYNPARWPYVSHFTGLDLVVRHIEEFVCPTVTSDQFIGGRPFLFRHDRRPSIVITDAAGPPESRAALRGFIRRYLDPTFHVTLLDGGEPVDPEAPVFGEDEIDAADLLVLADPARMADEATRIDAAIGRFIDQGRPVIGLRVAAAHAKESPAAALAASPFGIESVSRPEGRDLAIFPADDGTAGGNHPILAMPGVRAVWSVASIDGVVSLAAGAELLIGAGAKRVPVAWTGVRRDGGRFFATVAGGTEDFARQGFARLLAAAIHWAVDAAPPADWPPDPDERRAREDWAPLSFTGPLAQPLPTPSPESTSRWVWLRTLIPPGPPARDTVSWSIGAAASDAALAFLDGRPLERRSPGNWMIPPEAREAVDGLGLLVFRIPATGNPAGLPSGPAPRVGPSAAPSDADALESHWHIRISNDDSGPEHFPIPPQFGAPTDLIQPDAGH